MTTGRNTEHDRIRRIAGLLRQADRPLRVLRTLAWPHSVRERFFAAGARELPRVSYPRVDFSESREILATVKRELHGRDSPVDTWLGRQADVLQTGTILLSSTGTPEFFAASRQLYGAPADTTADGVNTTLDLARRLESVLLDAAELDLGAPPPACHLADHVAAQIREAVQQHFGNAAPEVVVVDELSANALAGPTRIRIRRQACFTDLDVFQLIHHEALIHVATSLNGRLQQDLPILASGHPGTTRTQEGLAVLAELMSGTMDVDRLRRLSDRILAIQMAVEGADFLEVYRFFLQERGLAPEQAFENSRRVFRGGVLSGGAPFTKDMVYLGGLLRVHNFLRAAVLAGRADSIRLLFCGKLDLEDLPALAQLANEGLCRPPRFLPPWASDLRFLVSYLAYSGFLNRVDLSKVREHYEDVLSTMPTLETFAHE